MKTTAIVLPFLMAACIDHDNDVDPPDPAPNSSCTPEVRARKLVTVSGTVVDFATGAPVANTTVDIGTAWDGTEVDCPVISTVQTGTDGTFGPLEIEAGSLVNPSFIMFTVRDGDRATTASDNRTCDQERCTLDHVIAAPSAALAASWRAELAAGGMADAKTRGLVAFEFRNADGSTSEGVQPSLLVGNDPPTRALVPGSEVRFLDTDRAGVLTVAQTKTSAAGIALVGANANGTAVFIGGNRGDDQWFSTGCLVEEGVIFLEDRTQAQ